MADAHLIACARGDSGRPVSGDLEVAGGAVTAGDCCRGRAGEQGVGVVAGISSWGGPDKGQNRLAPPRSKRLEPHSRTLGLSVGLGPSAAPAAGAASSFLATARPARRRSVSISGKIDSVIGWTRVFGQLHGQLRAAAAVACRRGGLIGRQRCRAAGWGQFWALSDLPGPGVGGSTQWKHAQLPSVRPRPLAHSLAVQNS